MRDRSEIRSEVLGLTDRPAWGACRVLGALGALPWGPLYRDATVRDRGGTGDQFLRNTHDGLPAHESPAMAARWRTARPRGEVLGSRVVEDSGRRLGPKTTERPHPP